MPYGTRRAGSGIRHPPEGRGSLYDPNPDQSDVLPDDPGFAQTLTNIVERYRASPNERQIEIAVEVAEEKLTVAEERVAQVAERIKKTVALYQASHSGPLIKDYVYADAAPLPYLAKRVRLYRAVRSRTKPLTDRNLALLGSPFISAVGFRLVEDDPLFEIGPNSFVDPAWRSFL